MKFEWQDSNTNINWQELAELYRRAPLGNKTAEDLKTAFSNSRYKYFVFAAGELVGAGRALADGVDCSYICDIAFLPEYQGQGLGREMLTRLIEHSKLHRKIILYSVVGKEKFYEKHGFKKMNTAMAIFKNEDYATQLGLINK